jgi:hypothetical protein
VRSVYLISVLLEDVMNRKSSGADGTRSAGHLRIRVVLLVISVVYIAGLAKRSFSLPSSSGSHWISQACKMRESCRAGSPSLIAQRTPTKVASQALSIGSARSPVEVGRSRPQTPGFFPTPSLRAPPSLA